MIPVPCGDLWRCVAHECPKIGYGEISTMADETCYTAICFLLNR